MRVYNLGHLVLDLLAPVDIDPVLAEQVHAQLFLEQVLGAQLGDHELDVLLVEGPWFKHIVISVGNTAEIHETAPELSSSLLHVGVYGADIVLVAQELNDILGGSLLVLGGHHHEPRQQLVLETLGVGQQQLGLLAEHALQYLELEVAYLPGGGHGRRYLLD